MTVKYVVHYYEYPATTVSWMQPSHTFRPMGLLLWDKSPGFFVDSLCVGATEQLVMSAPAEWFRSPYYPRQLELLARHGEIQRELLRSGVPELKLPACEASQRITVKTSKPITEFCMWGIEADGR